MKIKQVVLALLFCSPIVAGFSQEHDTIAQVASDTSKAKTTTVSFSFSPGFSLGSVNIKNKFVNGGLDFTSKLMCNVIEKKIHSFKIGIGINYQYLSVDNDNFVYANKDSVWFKNSGIQMKSNSLNLYYLTIPILYSNSSIKNLPFEIGLNNKFLMFSENLYREQLPYTTRMTENIYKNSLFKTYQSEIFIRIGIYKLLYLEAKQSLTPISGYGNFNARPFSISLGIN